MIKPIFLIGCIVSVVMRPISADILGNSLNHMLKQKDASGMVNLDGIRVGAKRAKSQKMNRMIRKTRPLNTIIGHYDNGRPIFKKEANVYLNKVTKGKIKDLDFLPKKQRLIVLADLQKRYAIKHFKSRPSTAIIATVNGINIRKKQADDYLKLVTHGKVKNFDRLPTKQRLLLVKDLAKPMVLKSTIEESLTPEEKEEIFKQMWIAKKRRTLRVSNEEMLALYEKKKAEMLAENPYAKIPPYMSLGNRLKNEILEKKMMGNLMKDANITVNYDTNQTVLTHELNQSSVKLDRIIDTKEQ